MYSIDELKNLEAGIAITMRQHFNEFFKSHKYNKHESLIMSKEVRSLQDIETLHYGAGFYLILTDYQAAQNKCTFEMDGLKAIYRGHCHTVKNRIKSHLLNAHYRASRQKNGIHYNVCMKIDNNNGINITNKPYCDYRWRVIIHKMKNSSKLIREQAELAFDEVFSRPLGSREKTKGIQPLA